ACLRKVSRPASKSRSRGAACLPCTACTMRPCACRSMDIGFLLHGGNDLLCLAERHVRMDWQREHLMRRLLGFGKVSAAIAEFCVGGLQMDRDRIVQAGLYALRIQNPSNFVALAHTHGIDVVDVPAPGQFRWR